MTWKNEKKLNYRLILCSISVFACTIIVFGYIQSVKYQGKLVVAFLDVGQGSAAYVKTLDGFEILIDTGQTLASMREFSHFRPFYDRHINMLIHTHPDKDHMGISPEYIERYGISTLVQPNKESESGFYTESMNRAITKDVELITTKPGIVLRVGASTSMVFYYPPDGNLEKVANNSTSLIFKLIHGETSFLFTGDAPASVEKYLAANFAEEIQSDVLVVGHHGSKTSSALEFLEAVSPQYGVISVGEENTYGHPNDEVLKRLEQTGMEVLRTDRDGTVVFVSDGIVVNREN